MATPAITVVVKVFFSKDTKGNIILESFPNDDFIAPPKAVSQITFQAVPSPSGAFAVPPVFAAAWPEGTNLGNVNIPGPFPAGAFTATIDNTNVDNFSANIKFQAQFGTGPNPNTVTGGGTIRNKGTTIWTIFKRELQIVSLVSLVIGAAIGVIFEKFFAAQ